MFCLLSANLRRVLVAIAFVSGIASFAACRAMYASGHPMIAALPQFLRAGGGRVGLALEFAVLLIAMALAFGGTGWAVGAYAAYALVNAGCAWMMLTGRI